jgi:hypothetical protein
MHSGDEIILLPGSPVTHASEEAEHAHLRAKREPTLGPKAEAFVIGAMGQATRIAATRKAPEN